MPKTFRAASFNVQNLFSRAKIFTTKDKSVGDQVMDAIDQLDNLLHEATYTPSVKKSILDLYEEKKFNGETLNRYVEIREDRGKLFELRGRKVVGVKANGSGEWDGAIEFKRADYSGMARENTAKVIKAVDADVACIVEAENRPTLVDFNRELLDSKQFKYAMLIDGNDPRGIDVGLLSNFPIRGVWTHIYDGQPRSRVFSRDCLDVELEMPDAKKLHVLCNHFKSRGYGNQAGNDARRKQQAQRVREILSERYDLANDRVIVAGDLNDSPNRPPRALESLLSTPNLFDVLELQFPTDPSKRWTYHYKEFEQIDYVLVSKPLRDAFKEAGVERGGIYQLEKITNGAEKEFDTVTRWTNAASDHGAVWAEFEL